MYLCIASEIVENFNFEKHDCKLTGSTSKTKKLIGFCRENGTIIHPPDADKVTIIHCKKNCISLCRRDLIPYTNLRSLFLNYKDVKFINLHKNLLFGKIT